jgi:hypothetical protein
MEGLKVKVKIDPVILRKRKGLWAAKGIEAACIFSLGRSW